MNGGTVASTAAVVAMKDKARHGGRRPGAGRPPKSEETRIQKRIRLTPRVWAFVAMMQLAHPGESESDALERICRSHILFKPD